MHVCASADALLLASPLPATPPLSFDLSFTHTSARSRCTRPYKEPPMKLWHRPMRCFSPESTPGVSMSVIDSKISELVIGSRGRERGFRI